MAIKDILVNGLAAANVEANINESIKSAAFKGASVLPAFNDFSLGLQGNWILTNNATNLTSQSTGARFTAAAQNFSGIRLIDVLKIGKKYLIELDIQLISGTAEICRAGWTLVAGEYIEFTPTNVKTTFKGIINIASGDDLFISVATENIGGGVYEISNIQLIEVNEDILALGDENVVNVAETSAKKYTETVGQIIDQYNESDISYDINQYSTGFTFTNRWGWASPIGSPQNFNAIQYVAKAYADLSKIKATIRINGFDGEILESAEIVVSILNGETKTATIIFENTIVNASDANLYIELVADGDFAFHGFGPGSPYDYGIARLVNNDSYSAPNWINFGGTGDQVLRVSFGNSDGKFKFKALQNDLLVRIKLDDNKLLSWNLNLRKWFSERAKTGKQINVGFFGDSWVAFPDITGALANIMWNELGFGGTGFQMDKNYLGDNSMFDVGDYAPVISIYGWTRIDQDDANNKGLFLNELISTGNGSTLEYNLFELEEITLFYYQQSGGGTFKYQIDGGADNIVDSNGADGVQITKISGLVKGAHTILITTTSAAPVKILGISSRNNDAGVVFHSLGNGSTRADHYLKGDQAAQRAQMAELDLDLVLILLGTNEQGNNTTPEDYTVWLGEMIDNIILALPFADIVICSSPDNNRTDKTFPMSAYNPAALKTAINKDCGFISTYNHFGEFVANPNFATPDAGESSDAYGMYDEKAPSFHLSPAGGVRFANIIWKYLQ
ncbi:MAG: GDSL-type esterase/lipase family protein [Cyclobacteriaceae bacterium]